MLTSANAFCCCNSVTDVHKFWIVKFFLGLQNGWGVIENRMNPQADTMLV